MCRTKKNPVPCLYRDKLFPSTGIKKRMRVACSVFVARDGHGITFFPDLSILQGDVFFFQREGPFVPQDNCIPDLPTYFAMFRSYYLRQEAEMPLRDYFRFPEILKIPELRH
jgi:hypothetical protein